MVLTRTVWRLVGAATHFLAHGTAVGEHLDPKFQLDFLGAVLAVELRTQDAFDLVLADVATVMTRHPPNRLTQGVRRGRGLRLCPDGTVKTVTSWPSSGDQWRFIPGQRDRIHGDC